MPATWVRLRERLVLVDDVLTINKPTVFPVNKDRPILFSALATADVLLTLDRADFSRLLGTRFYGLAIMTPGTWLTQEREPGRSIASGAVISRTGVCSVRLHADRRDTLRRKLPE